VILPSHAFRRRAIGPHRAPAVARRDAGDSGRWIVRPKCQRLWNRWSQHPSCGGTAGLRSVELSTIAAMRPIAM